MKGKSTLWLPGTDHAGLSTDEKIQEYFSQIGITPTKEQYLEKAWQWKEKHHSIITSQIKKMGASCDWSRERFTLDEGSQKAATQALKICQQHNMLFEKEGQWYLDMSTLASNLAKDIRQNKITIIPNKETGQLLNFLDHIEPWCISRQIWWGQQIPIWKSNENWCIAENISQAQAILNNEEINQCADTFDTWFLSSLWPFSALGWPEKTQDYERFYPAQLIETADDILFFWCARMLMMGKLCTGQYPFDTIYLHGIIRDASGQKMSKSKGNGIDPLEIIDKYGTDALRWSLACHTSAAQDMKISEQDFIAAKKFTNKLWQAGRFFHLHSLQHSNTDTLASSHDWPALIEFKSQYEKYLNEYDFLQAATKLQHLFKHEFCDHWIEQHKEKIFAGEEFCLKKGIAIYCDFLKMFHPFMPFITQKLWNYFHEENTQLKF